jgi:hypothetical protein
MSGYGAINAAGSTLEEVLRDHVVPPATGVSQRSPKDLGTTSREVSLWLYKAARNADLLNRRPERTVDNQVPRHPMPVDLHYLITPMDRDPAGRHEALGRAIQTLNDHAVLRGADLKPPLVDGQDQLRVMLEAVSTEDLARIWMALSMPFQVSVSYHVQLVSIDSDHEPVSTAPVLDRRTAYDQIVSVR